jgi:hypothetical protein
MRTVSNDALAALRSGRFKLRTLIKLEPSDTDPLCLWDDLGSIIVDSDVYVGKPGRFTVSPISSSADYSIRNMDVTLSGLDPTAVGLIESTVWHQRPILRQRAVISVDRPQILNLVEEFAGFMDQIEWGEVIDDKATLIIHCEDTGREYTRKGSRTASDADQRQRDADDGFLSFAGSAVTTTIDWGPNPQAPPKQQDNRTFFERVFGL